MMAIGIALLIVWFGILFGYGLDRLWKRYRARRRHWRESRRIG